LEISKQQGITMTQDQAVQALAALAQETRLAIFRFLVQQPDAVIAGDIAQAFAMAASTLSFHLKTLQQAGLVIARQEGRFIHYTPDRGVFNQLLGYLTENCCGGAGCPVTDKGANICQS
jgi:DNA-binding transcriptional ArsR family regulator